MESNARLGRQLGGERQTSVVSNLGWEGLCKSLQEDPHGRH